MLPVRLRGSTALTRTSSPFFSMRRTLRRDSTASGRAYCSPQKPATKRPPRGGPRGSMRGRARGVARQGALRFSRGTRGGEATGWREGGDEVPEAALDVGGESATGARDVVVKQRAAGGEKVEDVPAGAGLWPLRPISIAYPCQ